MSKPITNSYLTELRRIIWPIEGHEAKKFLPMAAMMFCILFNYSILRSVKDGLIVTAIGAEAISFLKTYVVLPSAVIAMIAYAKLCNVLSQQKVFYVVSTFFISYLAVFGLVLYPHPELVHPAPETIDALCQSYPNFKWFIRIVGHWSFATFYTIAELWGSMMLSLLFWQFANKITKTSEAKRFYSMFGLLGNCALPLAAFVLAYFLDQNTNVIAEEMRFMPIIAITIFSGIITMLLYKWLNDNVLTDPTLYDDAGSKSKKSKIKLSLKDSFKMIFTSKYLGLIAVLILSYGVSINLVEGVWKAKIRQLYPTKEAYTMFMGHFQAWQGFAAIICMLIGSNILRKVSWRVAATFTPLMILITGLTFFAFILCEDSVFVIYLTGIVGTGPLAFAVLIGMIQNVLSKATKYSLFDSTKEMAYIPLNQELQTKGKAAVEVIGGRFGKSGGGIIQSTFFMFLPSFSFDHATPYFGAVFFVIVILWLFGVQALSKEYTKLVK